MSKTARRLTIITLLMIIFALLFSDIVAHSANNDRQAMLNAAFSCSDTHTRTCRLSL